MAKATIETISPRQAEKMLAMNTGNFRPISKIRTTLYAQEMASGNWDCNGESIKMNGNELIDGQHRLEAIIESGIPITSVVVRGLESDGRTIDRGQPRSMAQWLSHKGIKNGSAMPGLVRCCIGYEEGLWGRQTSRSYTIPDSEIYRFIESHEPRLQEVIQVVSKSRPLIAGTLSGAVLFYGSEQIEDIAANPTVRWFFDRLTDGKMLDEDDAVFHLRNRLIKHSPFTKIPSFIKRSYMVIAWNKTVRGESCTSHQMTLRMTGPNKPKLPTTIERLSEVTA